jgi:hypothetical protein
MEERGEERKDSDSFLDVSGVARRFSFGAGPKMKTTWD